MSTPSIGAVLPCWPVPRIDPIRRKWARKAASFESGPDFDFPYIEGQPSKLRVLPGTERWNLSFGADSRGEPTTITAHLRPCGAYFDPDFAGAVGWEPRAEFWVMVWKLQEGLIDRFERAAALVEEVARASGGVVVLDHRDVVGRVGSGVYASEIAAYVTAEVFAQMRGEPGFAWRMA